MATVLRLRTAPDGRPENSPGYDTRLWPKSQTGHQVSPATAGQKGRAWGLLQPARRELKGSGPQWSSPTFVLLRFGERCWGGNHFK